LSVFLIETISAHLKESNGPDAVSLPQTKEATAQAYVPYNRRCGSMDAHLKMGHPASTLPDPLWLILPFAEMRSTRNCGI